MGYLQGGAGCHTEDDCAKRAVTDLGTSSVWADTVGSNYLEVRSGYILFSDPVKNPHFADAHHVYIPYCTGDYHTGQVTQPTSDQWGWYFDGHLNIQLIGELLSKNVVGVSKVDKVLLTGSSAGGIGTLNNCDWLHSFFQAYSSHPVDVKCVPLGGWFMSGFAEDQTDPDVGPSLWADWSQGRATSVEYTKASAEAIIHLHQRYLPVECTDARPTDEAWKCINMHVLYPYVTTPMYVVENQFESYHINTEPLMLPRRLTGTVLGNEYVAYTGRAMRNSTIRLVTEHPLGKVGDGLFLPSCFGHTENVRLGTSYQTVVSGFTVDVPAVLVDDCQTQDGLACNPTCRTVPSTDPTCTSEVHVLCGEYFAPAAESASCVKCATNKFAKGLSTLTCSDAEVQQICEARAEIVV